jgi:hypothetical protein
MAALAMVRHAAPIPDAETLAIFVRQQHMAERPRQTVRAIISYCALIMCAILMLDMTGLQG